MLIPTTKMKHRPRNSGGEHHAVGVVTHASCMNGGPQIELKTESGVVELHMAPGQTLNFSLSFDPPEGFNLCKSLNGYRAAASYTLDEAGGTRGTLTALRILGRAPDAEDTAQ